MITEANKKNMWSLNTQLAAKLLKIDYQDRQEWKVAHTN